MTVEQALKAAELFTGGLVRTLADEVKRLQALQGDREK